MASQQNPDFQYRTEDVAHLRGAYHGLRLAEDQAFVWSNIIGLPLGYYLGSRRNWSYLGKGLSGLVGGSLVFYTLTYLQRQSYNDIASKLNRTYSITVGKILEDNE